MQVFLFCITFGTECPLLIQTELEFRGSCQRYEGNAEAEIQLVDFWTWPFLAGELAVRGEASIVLRWDRGDQFEVLISIANRQDGLWVMVELLPLCLEGECLS